MGFGEPFPGLTVTFGAYPGGYDGIFGFEPAVMALQLKKGNSLGTFGVGIESGKLAVRGKTLHADRHIRLLFARRYDSHLAEGAEAISVPK